MRKWIAVLSVMLAAGAVHAQDTTATSTNRAYLTNEPSVPTERWSGWAPFAALNSGYMGYNTTYDVEGVPSSAKIMASYVIPPKYFVFDFGYGVNNQTFSQSEAASRNLGMAIGEFAARYQWENRWQAGVVWNTLFDVGSNYGANQSDAQFAGLQFLKEFNFSNNWMMRIGGRVMTSVNVPSENANVAMVDVQFGFNPWSGGRHGVRQEEARSNYVAPIPPADLAKPETATDADETAANPGWKEGPAMTEQPMPVSNQTGTSELWARRDFLLFDSGSAALDANDSARLERLAAALNDHPDMVNKIEIVGHADPTGKADLNEKLSQQRAEAVKKALVAKGVDADKISVVAKGEEGPLASNEKSRRAELHFQGVQDREALARVVNAVQ